jgi:hypothetical protein
VIDRRLFLVLALFTTAVAPFHMSMLDSASSPADAQAGEMGQTRAVRAATSTGRHGACYLPQRHESRTLPLLVFFHGTGCRGSLAILRLRALAEQEGFIVLAPDSVSVAGVWTVGQGAGDTTEDRSHIMAGVREVLGAPGVRIDLARVLAAGFSVGGNAAAHIATHEAMFTDLDPTRARGLGDDRVPATTDLGLRRRARSGPDRRAHEKRGRASGTAGLPESRAPRFPGGPHASGRGAVRARRVVARPPCGA